MRLPLSEPREIYKDSLETDNGSNIGSECSFEIDLPGKRDRSTVYRLNLIKLYRRKPELENLVMKNSSEGIDSETLYSVKLFMDFGFQGNLRKIQLYFKLPPDRSSYLIMINAKKKERFLPGPGTIVLRQKDINLVTGKPFRIKTCCSSQMLINSLREDTEYLFDLGVNGIGQSNRTLPVVWYGYVLVVKGGRKLCVMGFVKGILETGGVGQVCPDVDKELWRLGPDGSGDGRIPERKEKERWRPERRGREKKDKRVRERGRTEGDGKRVGERESEARLEWRKRAESENWSEKDDERRWLGINVSEKPVFLARTAAEEEVSPTATLTFNELSFVKKSELNKRGRTPARDRWYFIRNPGGNLSWYLPMRTHVVPSVTEMIRKTKRGTFEGFRDAPFFCQLTGVEDLRPSWDWLTKIYDRKIWLSQAYLCPGSLGASLKRPMDKSALVAILQHKLFGN
ncbi:uncharacterized protein TNCV_782161 [Trichonephila clavipes]|nr:uncharacterized protein TNCV_782161 [Trichonephila clavipes]